MFSLWGQVYSRRSVSFAIMRRVYYCSALSSVLELGMEHQRRPMDTTPSCPRTYSFSFSPALYIRRLKAMKMVWLGTPCRYAEGTQRYPSDLKTFLLLRKLKHREKGKEGAHPFNSEPSPGSQGSPDNFLSHPCPSLALQHQELPACNCQM